MISLFLSKVNSGIFYSLLCFVLVHKYYIKRYSIILPNNYKSIYNGVYIVFIVHVLFMISIGISNGDFCVTISSLLSFNIWSLFICSIVTKMTFVTLNKVCYSQRLPRAYIRRRYPYLPPHIKNKPDYSVNEPDYSVAVDTTHLYSDIYNSKPKVNNEYVFKINNINYVLKIPSVYYNSNNKLVNDFVELMGCILNTLEKTPGGIAKATIERELINFFNKINYISDKLVSLNKDGLLYMKYSKCLSDLLCEIKYDEIINFTKEKFLKDNIYRLSI